MGVFVKIILVFALFITVFFAENKDIGALPKGAKVKIYGGTIELLEIVNPEIIKSKFESRFTYDKSNNQKLKELASKYKLKDVVAGGKTEVDRMVFLSDWVHRQFKKFGQPTKKTVNALEILEETQKNGVFYCAQYSSVLISSCYSLGWVARELGLHKLLGNPGSTEHSVTEVWSNQYRKWVILDPTFNIFIEKDGLPLNGNEIRDEYFRNNGEDLTYVKGAEKQKYKKSDLPIKYRDLAGFSVNAAYIDWYSFLFFMDNSDYLDNPPGYSNKCFMIVDERNSAVKWHKREVPKDKKEAYWTLGEAKMSLTAGGNAELKIALTTNTPDFDAFLVKTDAGEWKETGAAFAWGLKPGLNKLTVTTRNMSGINGPENSVSLKFEQ